MRRTLSLRRTARRLTWLVGLAAFVGAPGVATVLSGQTAAASAQGARRIPWETSFPTALKKAAASRKPIMVDFWAEWCGYCHQLDRTTYADPEVIRLLADFVSVKVDTEGSAAEVETAMRYQVSSLPTVLFLTPEGRVVYRLSGYLRPSEFARTVTLVRTEGAKVAGWERTLTTNPRDALALMSLGLHLLDNEAFEEGRDLLVRAHAVEAGLVVADRKRLRLALGALRRVERDFPAAETLYKEGLALKPADGETDPQMLFALGRLYMSWGRRDDAVAALKRILADFPASAASDRARRALALLTTAS